MTLDDWSMRDNFPRFLRRFIYAYNQHNWKFITRVSFAWYYAKMSREEVAAIKAAYAANAKLFENLCPESNNAKT